MAVPVTTLPYLRAIQKQVTLPYQGVDNELKASEDTAERLGYGNLVFIFTDSVEKTIRMMNNKATCYHNNKYKYYYYNAFYKGKVANRRYSIRNLSIQKNLYKRVPKETGIPAHPIGTLDKAPARNCFFDMHTYWNIYHNITENLSANRKMTTFWPYFTSVWNTPQADKYQHRWVLIDADMWQNPNGGLKEKVDNPLFMLYYTMYKRFDLIQNLNIEFIIYCKKMVLRVNPSQCNNKSYLDFYRELKKILNRATGFDTDLKKLDEEDQKEQVKEALTAKYNFTGAQKEEDNTVLTNLSAQETSSKVDAEIKLKKIISDKVDSAHEELKNAGVTNTDTSATDYMKTKAEIDIESDDALIADMYKFMQTQKVPSKPISSARDIKMREKQESLVMGNVTFSKINEMNNSSRKIPSKDISGSIHNINPNMKKISYPFINKDYIENVMPQDIAKVFTSLNDKSMKLYVDNVEIKDSSDELNYKETYRVTLKDETGGRHIVTVDIPKFLDNRFLYLGGNKKIINKQNFLYPVVKTGPDTVQLVTNYNKIFIRRIGTKSISTVERIMKLVQNNENCEKFFVTGNNASVNKNFLTTIEYDEFGKVFTKFSTPNCTIYFNQAEATDVADEQGIKPQENTIFIGFKDKKPIFIDVNKQVTTDGQSICDLLVTELPDNLQNEFNRTRSTRKLMYTTAKVMKQAIPFIVLLIFWEGITSVFKKIGLKYYFSTRYPSSVKPNESVIRFADAYFVYEEDFATSLLMNGMKVLDTENHKMSDYDTSEPYLEYFRKVYGKSTIANAIANYYDFMIDPITKEVLEDINLPTDLIELCIYANSLLADESYTPENSQTLSRVRSIEIIPAILYYELSDQYLKYKNSLGKKKISLPRDCVIKQLMALQTVEDYSTLNPVVELEKTRAITSKGYKGINVERAYTEEKRSYHDTMEGILAMGTSPDGNCGINRFLTMEPMITSTRGYVDIKKDSLNDLKDVNIFSPAELLYPLGNTRDDSIRTWPTGLSCRNTRIHIA